MNNEGKAPDPRYDVAAWTNGALAWANRMGESKIAVPSQILPLTRTDPRFVYALLIEFIASQPNGLLTRLQQGAPLENPVWWDFLLAHEDHLIGITSTVNGMEAHLYSIPEGFNPERFLLASTSRYRDRVNARASSFERHKVFVNHYRSYRESVEWLQAQIAPLDLTLPKQGGGIIRPAKEVDAEMEELGRFRETALRFHVLAKSLLASAAFMCEALIGTILRIRALPQLKLDPENLLLPVLRTGFVTKLQVIHGYTICFPKPIDIEHEVIRDALRLMDTRNKFVHSALSEHAQLPDIYFDGLFPLYGGGLHGELGAFLQRAYLTPSRDTVLNAAATAFAFDAFIRNSFDPRLRPQIEILLEQPQLSYNTIKRTYSMAFAPAPFQMHVSPMTEEEALAEAGTAAQATSANERSIATAQQADKKADGIKDETP